MKKFLTLLGCVCICCSVFSALFEPDRSITELMRACRDKDASEVEALLKAGANPNFRTIEKDEVALDYAVYNPRPYKIIKLLLDHGADPVLARQSICNLIYEAMDEKTAERRVDLHQAILLLLNSGADFDYDYILDHTLRFYNKPDLRDLLLKMGAMTSSYTASAIVYDRSNESLKQMLQDGINFDGPQRFAFDKSKWAIVPVPNEKFPEKLKQWNWSEWVNLEMLSVIISYGYTVDVDDMVKAGNNPHLAEIFDTLTGLYRNEAPLDRMVGYAVYQENSKNLEFLMGKGATVEDAYKQLISILSTDQDCGCCQKRSLQTLKLFHAHKLDINLINLKTGMTELMRSAKRKDLTTLEFLLKNEVPVNAADQEGNTALHHICYKLSENPKNTQPYLNMLNMLKSYKADFNLKNKNGNTPLHVLLSSRKSRPEIIRRFIELGSDVNARNNEGITPLMLSALNHPAEISELLLANGADINALDNNGRNALFYPAKYWFKTKKYRGIYYHATYDKSYNENCTANIKLLLKSGIKGDVIDKTKASAMTEAAAWADVDTLRLLYQAGGEKVVKVKNNMLEDAIIMAADANNSAAVIEFLLQSGADPNSRGLGGLQKRACAAPILGAINNLENLKVLLKYGADPNSQFSEFGKEYTVLTYCPISYAAAKLLFEHGAKDSPEIKYRDIMDFQKACWWKKFEDLQKDYEYLTTCGLKLTVDDFTGILLEAARFSSPETVSFLYEDISGKTIFGQEYISKLFAQAAQNSNYPGVIRFLKEKNPEFSFKDFAIPQEVKEPEIIDFLIKNGLNIKLRPILLECSQNPRILKAWIRNGANLNARDSEGNTALPKLLSERNRSRVALLILLKAGANPNFANQTGGTPLDLAIKRGMPAHFDTLIEYGADVTQIHDHPEVIPYIAKRLIELKQ